jgi:hypothetical protein
MSLAPSPSGRIEPKYKLRPSFEIAGPCSPKSELIWHPRFVGAAQSENSGDAVIPVRNTIIRARAISR